ncbi:MAG TPA: DUF1810 domain-containing protein [Edaphobacter sp.]|nr:DUF1810 domain-containing protein [Edaphobacter sp.]
MAKDEAGDRYNLQRFVDAQAEVFEQACSELREGRKRSHWMWFIFPQIRGLGSSSMAGKFAISSLAEARAYLDHVVLGPRLRECSRIVAGVEGRSVHDIFGYPDDLKFYSSMTLFTRAATENQVFMNALERYFGGKMDRMTLELLAGVDNDSLARPPGAADSSN